MATLLDSRVDLVAEVEEFIRTKKAETKKATHWSDLTKHFVEGKLCDNDQLVAAVNSILLPNGPLKGCSNSFWFDK